MLYIRGCRNHGWCTKYGLSPAFVGPEGHECFLCFFPVGKKKKKIKMRMVFHNTWELLKLTFQRPEFKFCWRTAVLIRLCIVSDCFHTNRDPMACKSENIYCLVLSRTSLPIPAIEQQKERNATIPNMMWNGRSQNTKEPTWYESHLWGPEHVELIND